MTPASVGILTLPGFNEIDSFVAARILGSIEGISIQFVGPTATAVSKSGVEVIVPGDMDQLRGYDAIWLGSGCETMNYSRDKGFMAELGAGIEPTRLLGAQCSGAIYLHRLGLLGDQTVCTDQFTAPLLQAEGIKVKSAPFQALGNIASAGGCLASVYLSVWMAARLQSLEVALSALQDFVPAGEAADYVERSIAVLPNEMTQSVAVTATSIRS